MSHLLFLNKKNDINSYGSALAANMVTSVMATSVPGTHAVPKKTSSDRRAYKKQLYSSFNDEFRASATFKDSRQLRRYLVVDVRCIVADHSMTHYQWAIKIVDSVNKSLKEIESRLNYI